MKKTVIFIMVILVIWGIVSSSKAQGQTAVALEQATLSVPEEVATILPSPTVATPEKEPISVKDAALFTQRAVSANSEIISKIEFVKLTAQDLVILNQGSQEVALASLPIISGFGPPCVPGESFYVTGYVFGQTNANGYVHPGTDGACTSYKVAALAGGVLIFKGNVDAMPSENFHAWESGEVARFKHKMMYAGREVACISSISHLVTGSVLVEIGQEVTAGQHIATMGSTGNSSGPHQHVLIACDFDGVFTWLDPMLNGAAGTR